MKSEYLANISHETKTPLAGISSNIQLARELYEDNSVGGKDGEIIAEALRQAQEDILRVARMGENSLWLANIQNNTVQKKPIDTAIVLKNAAESYRNFIEKNGNTFTVKVAKVPMILASSDQLVHVIANILTNTNTFTKNGRVAFEAWQETSFVKVTVTDSGRGIEPDMLPKVFQRGMSGSGSSGVGLAICKDIIEAHNGVISIMSDFGKGTTVTFLLPIYIESREAGSNV